MKIASPLVVRTTRAGLVFQAESTLDVSLDEATLAREKEFFSRRDGQIDFAAEVGEANDSRQLRIIGVLWLAPGLAILLFLNPASGAGRAGKNRAMSISTMSLGSLMLWFAGTADRNQRSL